MGFKTVIFPSTGEIFIRPGLRSFFLNVPVLDLRDYFNQCYPQVYRDDPMLLLLLLSPSVINTSSGGFQFP